MSRETMRVVGRTVAIGSPLALALSIVFAPFAIVSVALLFGGGMALVCGYSFRARRWSWTVYAFLTALVTVSSAVMTWNLWGIAFDESDAGRTVPAAVNTGMSVCFFAMLAGLLAYIAILVTASVKGRRGPSIRAAA